MELNKRIFNSVEEIKEYYRLDVIVPHIIEEGCNIICYTIDMEEPFHYYKEDYDGKVYSKESFGWHLCSPSLESLVASDTEMFDSVFIYLHSTQQEKKEKFTPKRLLGVETNEGFINKLNQNIKGFVNIGYTTCDPRELQYYISDYSDETVSFDKYVDMFYERE